MQPYNSDLDFLDDSVLLAPEIDKMLTEISSAQVNVRSNISESSSRSIGPNIQLSNVSGGVFNFYINKWVIMLIEFCD